MNVTRSRNSGCCSQEDVEGGEPAQHVLRQVGAVDAQDQVVAAAAQKLRLVLGHLLGAAARSKLARVDAERVGAHPGLAACRAAPARRS